jgi:acetyl-CoA carboxylase biotin carboxyl carrier protein
LSINRERILELLEILKASSAAELSVTEGDTTVRLARFVEMPAPVAVSAEAGGQPCPEPEPDEVTVKARVVGLFYRGKEPGLEPLVKVGDHVKNGQRLGIIEVHRKPTDVTSPVDGLVSDIKGQDGSGVQYGDALFVIRP